MPNSVNPKYFSGGVTRYVDNPLFRIASVGSIPSNTKF